ncbi:MAG TPA: CDP-glucose 4,6-dehydratase [Coriobacteriia bacterium]|nr:CDP-glucose 4,6-dehydratase [Coriobacteriia bacterium]
MPSAPLFGGVYEGRRVFVTGHTGFKGSWLVTWLLSLGAEVTGYSLEPPTDPSLFEQLGLASRIDHHIGDVRDLDHLREVMVAARPEIVMHLAAQPLVRLSYDEPVETYATNVMGTVHVLEAARSVASVRVVLNVTSDKCYENNEWEYAYRENDPMGGYDPYSSSKGCAELVTAAYRRSFYGSGSTASVSSARAGNVIGGGDWALDRIIPDCIRALSEGDEIGVRNPGAVRPWQHVLEPLSGYLWLAASQFTDGDETHPFDGAWNFGPSPAGNITVAEVVETVIGCWGDGGWSTPQLTAPAVHEARFLKLDYSKAADLLGWRPAFDVHEALSRTVGWYRDTYHGVRDAETATNDDISAYVAAATAAGVAWTR